MTFEVCFLGYTSFDDENQEHHHGITLVIIMNQVNNSFMNNGSFCIMVF